MASSGSRSPSPPRALPTAQPELLGDDCLVEEEAFSWYDPDDWYPVKIGDVFESRYQVLLKLGFGSVSTAWLCRDLREHKYVTVKVYVTGHRQARTEYKVLQHIGSVSSDHPGRKLVRLALDSFELPGNKGPHVCIVHEPLGLSLAELRDMFGGQIPPYILKGFAYRMLMALDFLHREARVVHTDIQPGNILFVLADATVLDKAVEGEWEKPGLRKVDGDRVVYCSTDLGVPDDLGDPIICDFGDAQFGDPPFLGEVMPDLFRSPEIVLAIPWDRKIDIWAFGLMIWHLLEGDTLFTERLPSRDASTPAHLARMISLLGPPPPDLLEKGNVTANYFNDDGKWPSVGLPPRT
ncbi:uncharacterized protein THITE_2118248 [Thermothielavioides terrestris NRRL 8126]|uniref:non-specific serine/threonine protein kinase n=1 Tax=Thermothielavioides terrestris (strain ATCC 38088 / NRRL 8126) TaxID=578455 RepID=G2R958_THETT|nr:uncharacterized protein THITE_2118248 [Thermothielavioides terrestris NRRL 8126]AEO68653.1 hypothetical protein THITE_2118248 [Thermothielavioides terrestris NRRL 8126]